MTRYTGTARVTSSNGNATRVAGFSVRRLYGTNNAQHATVTPALAGVNFVKVFTTGVPKSWPGPNPVPPGTTALVCITPDPKALLAGKLDGQIGGFLKGAPDGSWLTAHQEGNDPASPFWAAAGTTNPAFLGEVHAYLSMLVARTRPGVRYGQDFGSYPIYAQGQDCTAYSVPGLAWYSFDGYQRETDPKTGKLYTAAQVFAGMAQVRAKWPGCQVAVTETNSFFAATNPAGAAQWFTDAYTVAQGYGAVLFSTWWGAAGHVLAFDPRAPYVGALNKISADCAA